MCGACSGLETCGGGGTPSVCGTRSADPGSSCVPKTCVELGTNCGPVADGCGGLLMCGTCASPTSCGGGGTASVCGGSALCIPRTCAALGANCGPAADGCGGLVDCGTCAAPQTCGGGGVASMCGSGGGGPGGGSGGSGGGPSCIPRTCMELGANCGPVADGCGGLLNCGACTAPQTCGGGGTPSICGGNSACVPHTCVELGTNCGPVADGCGGLLDCGTCGGGAICGGGGPSICGTGSGGRDGGSSCVPKTCVGLGANCGPVADGCGGLLNCGACSAPKTCGGGGVPSVCGGTGCVPPHLRQRLGQLRADRRRLRRPRRLRQLRGARHLRRRRPAERLRRTDPGTPSCVGLQCSQVTCPNGGKTTVSGTVYDPAGKMPLYNVTVYVPNAAGRGLRPRRHLRQVRRRRCRASRSRSPRPTPRASSRSRTCRSARTSRWSSRSASGAARSRSPRSPPAPTPRSPTSSQTRLPRKQSEGDIPLMALTTGGADPLECLLRKIGIDDSRVHRGRAATGASTSTRGQRRHRRPSRPGGTFTRPTPCGTRVDALSKYDVVLLACEGAQNIGTKSVAARQAVVRLRQRSAAASSPRTALRVAAERAGAVARRPRPGTSSRIWSTPVDHEDRHRASPRARRWPTGWSTSGARP